jgi:diadenosine tetraphosphatase ApaH/serine/threonine PP2A family protein phosphatase
LESTAVLSLHPGTHYLINPGSVGQPRDTDWRAAYCIYDDEDAKVTYCRARYDVEAAAKSILAAGLPELLAKRLYLGK